jgi:hypothetical protein
MLSFEEFERDGKSPVSEWIDDLSTKDQVKATRFMEFVRRAGRVCYPPHFRKFRELCEARWFGDNGVPHRIFCCGDGPTILLCGFIHKGRRYKPPGAYDTALEREKAIKKGEATTHEFTLGKPDGQGIQGGVLGVPI